MPVRRRTAPGLTMARQIVPDVGTPSIVALEDRIRQLETKVALLAHAVEALAAKLEGRRENDA